MQTADTVKTDQTAQAQILSEGGPVSKSKKEAPAQRGAETVDYERVEPDSGQQTQTGGKPPWDLLLFAAIVILPFLASLIYFVFIAEDQYTAEARFTVRSLADNSPEVVTVSLLNMAPAPQDAYVVTSFIHSTALLDRIRDRIDYRAMFRRSGYDFIGSFSDNGSSEAFLDYWKGQVSAYIDGPSNIITLRVRTFRPEDSIRLANAILEESEKLINELSDRSRHDMIAGSMAEVERAGKAYGATLAALNNFQKQSALLNPQVSAMETGALLTGLIAKKLEFDSRLFMLQQSGGTNSPAYRQLLIGREAMEAQIEEMRGKMTGSENKSFADSLAEFSRLDTDRMVAEKLYEATRRNYEMTLMAAMRKGLYLTVFVKPLLPEEALYPRRFLTPLLMLIGFFVLWAVVRLIWASVEDHRL